MAQVSKINMGGIDYDIRDKVLEQEVANIKPIVNQGTINNAPDEEDLTTEGDYLKLKDRSSIDGMGYVILRKGKTLQEQIANETTIYEIRYDYDLDGGTLTIPSNCVLKFIGGRIFNGTVVFNNTMIECESAINILPEQCSGYIRNKIIYPEWFIADADCTNGIQTAIDVTSESGAIILFTGNRYLVRGGVLLFKSNITFKSECNSTIYTEDAENYQAIFFSNSSVSSDNVTFDGLKFDQSAQVDCVINGEHAKMYCILTWKSVNLTVKNCKFINVGTNCVVCNGNECHNTSILNNYFHFLRCKNGGNYDNSVVYISDSYHRIEGNTIINDGTAANRSRGGIETHGTCGVVANNTISNCNNGINIVEISTTKEGVEPNRLITNNTCFNCTTFCAFWPVTEFNPIRNVTISNNKATNVINAVRTIISEDLKGTIENVEICNNYFEGRYKLIEEKLSNDELYEAAFALFGYGDVLNFRIHNNVISSFPKFLLSTSPWRYISDGSSYTQEIYFTDNNCINCFNSKVKESVIVDIQYALFKVGVYTNMIVKDNILSIPEADRNGHLYAFLTMAYGIEGFVWENNKFTDVVTIDYTVGKSSDASKIYSDLVSPGNKIYAYDNIKNQCFYPGDVLIDQDTSLYVTEKGHKAPLPFEGIDATIAYQYSGVAFLSGTGIENISVGDYLHLRLASAELYATVTEKTANGYYLTSTSFGSSVDGAIVWLKHVVAKTKDYGKSYIFATGSEPEASFGTLGYNTTAKTPVSFNGSKWVDAFGFTPLPHAGTDAALPNADKGLTPYDYGFTFYNYNSKKLLVWDSTKWINVDGSPTGMGSNRGGTSNRPTLTLDNAGFVYFDTTLKKPLWWTGSEWVDATGATA